MTYRCVITLARLVPESSHDSIRGSVWIVSLPTSQSDVLRPDPPLVSDSAVLLTSFRCCYSSIDWAGDVGVNVGQHRGGGTGTNRLATKLWVGHTNYFVLPKVVTRNY